MVWEGAAVIKPTTKVSFARKTWRVGAASLDHRCENNDKQKQIAVPLHTGKKVTVRVREFFFYHKPTTNVKLTHSLQGVVYSNRQFGKVFFCTEKLTGSIGSRASVPIEECSATRTHLTILSEHCNTKENSSDHQTSSRSLCCHNIRFCFFPF